MADSAILPNLRWTKLSRPRIAGEVVRRVRVRERLERGLERPLTLVCAPAGYGKTTLLSDWLAQSGHACAWLSLDEGDNDLAVFLSYFVAAIRSVYPDACASTFDLLRAPELPPASLLVTALANDVDALPCGPGPADRRCLILVLDDYHLVRDAAVHALLAELWRHPPRTVHLIISTRHDPPLPLNLLRGRGELNEMRARELRFTLEEAAAVIQLATGLRLDEQAIGLLAARTEGWAAGLRLAALTLVTGDDIHGQLVGLPEDHRYVMDYLMDEVLSRVPASTQDFLFKTSILDRLSGPLCDAVAGTAGTPWTGRVYLEWLAQQNLFTWSLDPRQQWYRYHHLFQRLLRNRLEQQLSSQEIAQLHTRASAWFAVNSLVDEAIAHALAGGDVTGAVQLVEAHRHGAINQGRWPDLQRWLGRLPWQVVEERPELVIAEAWLHHHRGSHADTATRLTRAGVLVQQTPLAEAARLGLQGEVDALGSELAYWAADAERAIALGRRALEETPIERSYVRGIAWMFVAGGMLLRGDIGDAIATLHEGLREDRFHSNIFAPVLLITQCFAYWMAADLPSLLQTAGYLLDLARERDLPDSIDWGHYFRGCAHYQQNRVADAQRDFAAVVGERMAVHGQTLLHSAFGLASAYQASGLAEPARATAESVVKYALETNNAAMLAVARAFAAHLAVVQSREGEAAGWAAQAGRNVPMVPMPLFYAADFSLAEILLAQGTPASLEEAAGLLARLREVVQTTHNTRFLIEVLALQALLHDARRERDAAMEALKQAVVLAELGGVIRVFVDLGPRMAALLHQLAARQVAPGFIARLLDAFPAVRTPEAAPRQAGLIEPLSERELEVLALLAQRLSNKEIAHELSISPSTVKRHATNIYQKLLVQSRREAVVRAGALGILPPPR